MELERQILGNTGLNVSVAGLGCGGHSRLGTMTGSTFGECVDLVRSALDLGINYIDTAPAYGTEGIVGAALIGRRDQTVLSTKANPLHEDGSLFDASQLRHSVEQSLRELRTDFIDVFHLHGITDGYYDYCVVELLPELVSLRDDGMIRFIALSERFAEDPGHKMLERATRDDYWDVIMVGLNIINFSARELVLPATQAKGTGVEVMFAVRRALSDPATLRALVAGWVERGLIEIGTIDQDDPLGFLVHQGGASSVMDAAYRFARHEPGCHVVLTGTGSTEHLRSNIRSLQAPPLPDADRERIDMLFGQLKEQSGD
jgi:L-galactose dehydrogenase